jgi:hypothetical protein
MTTDQRTVLHFMALGWKLRNRRRWLLKQPDYVSNFEDCPGGQATIDELRARGYIDERNNITPAGVAAFGALEAELAPENEQNRTGLG